MTTAHRCGRYDVVVVGGGHNGLVAAAYLARAGLSVLVLERLDHTGGAAVSAQPFAGRRARLSRYSYLVSLMPEQLDGRPGARRRSCASRPTASYTPCDARRRAPRPAGRARPRARRPRASFRELTGCDEEYDAWRGVLRARWPSWPSVVAPDADRAAAARARRSARRVDDRDLGATSSSEPLGAAIERRFADDTVRGVVATDALIGTFADLHDPSLVQNRCFLYHLIGNGTGEWRVPGRRHGRGHRRARARPPSTRGAEIVTGAGGQRHPAGRRTAPRSTWHDGGATTRCAAAVRARQRRAVGAAHPARRAEDPATEARGLAAQDQLAARPAARGCGRASTPRVAFAGHAAPRRGLQPARGGVRRGRGRPAARRRCRARSTATR